LYPAVDGDVINLDTAFGEEFFDVAIRQPVVEVSAHSRQDHLGREPIPGKRGGLNRAAAIHQNVLPSGIRSVEATVPSR